MATCFDQLCGHHQAIIKIEQENVLEFDHSMNDKHNEGI
jgi:hypothetical protein